MNFIFQVVCFSAVIICKEQDRIVGGSAPPTPFAYPWVTAILNNGIIHCGGALIAPTKVLTAAHCIVDDDVKDLSVSLHRYNLTLSDDQEQGATYNISNSAVHPKYNHIMYPYYDSAVLTLSLPSDDKFISNINLPFLFCPGDEELKPNDDLTVIGWGATETELPSDVQLVLEMPLVTDEECKRVYDDIELESLFCAGVTTGGKDACGGDSGGPLVKFEGDDVILYGIVSFGMDCGGVGNVGAYSKVSAAYDFIIEQIQI